MVADLNLGLRLAIEADFGALPEVEAAADRVFADIGMWPLPAPAPAEELRAAAAVIVAGEPPVGFARLEVVDGQAHLEQLSVHPSAARRGIGTALLDRAVDCAIAHGFARMSLITFRDVTWNAPFYAARGFVPLPEEELGPGLQERRRIERDEDGMDALGPRVVMTRTL
jgi:GNAT superfamily N-acetyltransferase